MKSIKSRIDSIWEIPLFYKILQSTLAGGGHSTIKKFLIGKIPKNADGILDQGCGTGEYSLLFKKNYTGLDNNSKDINYAKKIFKGVFVIGTATKMPFQTNNFSVVFAVGLHHHLTNNLAKKAILESIRVTKKQGKIIIIDAMMPKNPLNLPGWFLRKMDRGGHVRKFEDTLKLLPKNIKYDCRILSSFPFDYVTIILKKD